MAEKKLFAGARLKRLRKQLGLTQAKMAAEIGVSASYLNLMERNQRPISARVLIRLAETFEFDLKSFAAAPDQSTLLALREAAADPALSDLALDLQDLKELADAHPRAAQALILLHQSHRGAASDLASLSDRLDDRQGEASSGGHPLLEVRNALQAQGNYFAELEDAAQTLIEEARLEPMGLEAGLKAFLMQVHGVRTRVLPADVMRDCLRRYDRHSRRLFINELLDEPSRRFALAVQAGLLEQRELLDALQARPELASRLGKRYYRQALANYFAAALLMPYGPFLQSATELRHDLPHLCRRFGASLEQVCHRLTTLRRPGAGGVDFFLLRADPAGNITKRFGTAHFAFAKAGGSCPRLALWAAAGRGDEIIAQRISLEGVGEYFTLSRAIAVAGSADPHQRSRRLIMLGCKLEEAKALVYADEPVPPADHTPTQAGLNCRLCERANCTERAFAPLNKRLYLDEHKRAATPFVFSG